MRIWLATALGHLRRLAASAFHQTGPRPARQVAALPVKLSADGGLRVLLITGRRSGRAIIPRGWPMRGKPDHHAAAIEAEEEAGVTGFIHPVPIGVYAYRKNGAAGMPVRVTVYRLDVRRQLRNWREKGQRQRLWLTIDEAVERTGEPGLVPILRELPAILALNPPPQGETKSDTLHS